MYHFGIEREMIDFIVDDSPLKQGHYTPGMHIPVVPAAPMYQHRPDYLLILAWNFARADHGQTGGVPRWRGTLHHSRCRRSSVV